MCRDMGGYRCGRTWVDTNVYGHDRMQVCEVMGENRGVGTWGDVDVRGHGKMQMCRDMEGCKCMRI